MNNIFSNISDADWITRCWMLSDKVAKMANGIAADQEHVWYAILTPASMIPIVGKEALVVRCQMSTEYGEIRLERIMSLLCLVFDENVSNLANEMVERAEALLADKRHLEDLYQRLIELATRKGLDDDYRRIGCD